MEGLQDRQRQTTVIHMGVASYRSLGVRLGVVIMLMAVTLGCADVKKPRYIPGDDTPRSGTIHVSADESFQPVIDSQVKVFMNQHPDANIIVHYKPEAECLKDLTDDSTRLVIVTRGLSDDEMLYYEDTLQFRPSFGVVAHDAIAVIVNNASKDSLFSVADVRGMLSGRSGYRYQQVMDGTIATSTVRFMLDSVLRGFPFSSAVVAARSSEGVIDYVSRHPDAVGYIGVNWIGDRKDPQQLSFQRKVRIAALQCANCEEEVYVKPYQANIALKRYPLRRDLYYILKENYSGLGRGFVNFMSGEKGQLIFKQAYLVPGRLALQVRRANISE
jgi:phosphate transport system substrate-binding protein